MPPPACPRCCVSAAATRVVMHGAARYSPHPCRLARTCSEQAARATGPGARQPAGVRALETSAVWACAPRRAAVGGHGRMGRAAGAGRRRAPPNGRRWGPARAAPTYGVARSAGRVGVHQFPTGFWCTPGAGGAARFSLYRW
ncbi:hypothetical protein PAHAL_9G076700 [Panicum hallii]|jgi:hypothetical protein|uniref:Uncharacterized protein n=1 Tax=Panicum hallii TaxID=206008 RepID=A0A2T8I0I3_9POAL|nr:hypothetical protein PAHAL_9G076700 [Panicum hallii]